MKEECGQDVWIKGNRCYRCGHKWIPRKPDNRLCPKCKNSYWHKPKIKTGNKQ